MQELQPAAVPMWEVSLTQRILKWGLPKIRSTFLGVPIIRTIVFWGLYWGPLILGNYQINEGTKVRILLHREFVGRLSPQRTIKWNSKWKMKWKLGLHRGLVQLFRAENLRFKIEAFERRA